MDFFNDDFHEFIENRDNSKFISNKSVLKKHGKYGHSCNGKKCQNGIRFCKFHMYYCDYGEGLVKVKHDRSWKNYRKTQYKVKNLNLFIETNLLKGKSEK